MIQRLSNLTWFNLRKTREFTESPVTSINFARSSNRGEFQKCKFDFVFQGCESIGAPNSFDVLPLLSGDRTPATLVRDRN